MSLRVLHQRSAVRATDDDLVAWARRSRAADGCREAAVSRAVDEPDRLVVTELWADERAHGEYWSRARTDPVTRALLDAPVPDEAVAPGEPVAGTEFHPLARYGRAEGVWVPEDPPGGAVTWPARGAVRAVSLSSSDPDDDGAWPGSPEVVAETRREPGCGQFRAYRGIEHPQDVVLLELWSDQARYDAHWALRLAARASGAVARGSARAAVDRGHGTNGMEFYRYQGFVALYDRWLPAGPGDWSQTVVWSR